MLTSECKGLKWTILWDKQQLCNPARANKDKHEDAWKTALDELFFFFVRTRTEITPRGHDWCTDVWLCVMCSRSCSNPIRMVKCSQIGMALFDVCFRCDTRHFSRGTWSKHRRPEAAFWNLISPQCGFSPQVYFPQQPGLKPSMYTHSAPMWGAFIPLDCALNFINPCMCTM